MQKRLAGISLIAICLSTGALALNPQPEPPGRHKGIVTHSTGTMNTTGAMHAGSSADVDDNYCGTPVPGHPHVNAMGGAMMQGHTAANGIIIEGNTAAHCNAHTLGSATGGAGSGKAHANSIGSATAGAGSGR